MTVACGKFEKQSDILKGYLKKDERKNIVKVFDKPIDGAKEIATKYTVLGYYPDVSLVEVELLTGRTHQIRAHLASIGHPLLNDGKYGDTHGRFKQELYSYKLKFDFSTDAGILNYLNQKEFEIQNCKIEKLFTEKKY